MSFVPCFTASSSVSRYCCNSVLLNIARILELNEIGSNGHHWLLSLVLQVPATVSFTGISNKTFGSKLASYVWILVQISSPYRQLKSAKKLFWDQLFSNKLYTYDTIAQVPMFGYILHLSHGKRKNPAFWKSLKLGPPLQMTPPCVGNFLEEPFDVNIWTPRWVRHWMKVALWRPKQFPCCVCYSCCCIQPAECESVTTCYELNTPVTRGIQTAANTNVHVNFHCPSLSLLFLCLFLFSFASSDAQ